MRMKTVEQFGIDNLEKDMEVMEAHVDTLRIRSVQQEELHNPPHPFMPQVTPLKHKESGGIR